ncbi:MAG: penicillin-binding protein activator [candidate division WOR-3 bacterium]
MRAKLSIPIGILFLILNCIPEVSPPEDSKKLYEKAMKAYTDQNYKKAKELFAEVTKTNPPRELMGNSFFYLGEINKAIGNNGEALVNYVAASKYGINTTESVKELAILVDENSLKKSLLYASQELKPFLLYTIGRKLQSEGRTEESKKYFEEIIIEFPKSEYARKAQYITYPKGKKKVGVLLPLSGSYIEEGTSVKNGIEIGAKERFIPIYVDTREDPLKSYKEAVRLIENEKVSGIIGPLLSKNSFAIACVADYKGIPFISPTATKEFIDSVGPKVFIINKTIQQQAIAMAEYAVKELGLRTFSILYPRSDYGETFESVFSDKILELGGKIVSSISYGEGERDFQSELNRIKSTEPEAIYIPASTQDVPAIASHIKYCGIKSQILGTDSWKSEKIFKQQVDPSALEGIIITDNPFNPSESFLEEFKFLFRKEPDRYACLGYDAAILMSELLENPNKKLDNIPLTAGSINLSKASKGIRFYLITNGTFKLIK